MLKRKSVEKTDSNKKSTRSTRSATRKEKEEVDLKAAAGSASPGSPSIQSPIQSATPISAIAARRALELVATTESDQQQDTDNDIDQQLEQEQITDWDSEIEENEPSDAESEAENVNSKSKEARSVIKRVKPEKVKTAQYDPKAISLFTPSSTNVVKVTSKSNDEILVIGLKKDEGQALFAPLLGSFSAIGAVFGSDDPVPSNLRNFECPDTVYFVPMFSPKTHSLICIEPTQSRINTQLYQHTAIAHKMSFPIRKQLTSAFTTLQQSSGRFSTIIAVKSLGNSGIVDVERILPLFKGVFNLEDAKPTSEDPAVLAINAIPGFYPILEPTPNVKVMQIPTSWTSSVNQFLTASQSSEDAQVALICGSKRMGKSTFSKYMVNRLLEKHPRIAFLEADIGQPEFGIQGVVSLYILDKPLLGPPFANSHLEAKRRFFIGSITPRDDPDYYMACLNELLTTWRQEVSDQVTNDTSLGEKPVPLVINTHGWIKGLGYDLLMDLIHTAAPNFILAFQSTLTPSRNLPPSFITSVVPPSSEATVLPKILYLTSLMDDLEADVTAQKYHPSDHRMLNLVSYMHMNHMGKRAEGNAWWDFKTRLVERVPWCLDWTVGLQGIWVFFEEIKYSQLLFALNGSVVGLISETSDEKNTKPTPSGFIAPPFRAPASCANPSPKITDCYGLGLIRTVDVSKSRFMILTPLPFDTLTKVNGIVKGDLELPIWGMLDSRNGAGAGITGVPWRKVPYVSFDANEGIGSSALRIRRNVMRKSQM
ncbi:hypothetical protein INT44_002395 [Umbelopsis vinacea]|uniref:Polynucleotide 5'-hydroxyl-kinase GRC3 n=1 Tax=Umbelopsis vinacea TaxID=44442 RepID=A0A8H7UKZ6_9FUNG|nr:hypothetical protein INT44_002395 [Umbelopsis vinacea]